MTFNYHFEDDNLVLYINYDGGNYSCETETIKIPRSELIQFLGLKDLLRDYHLAQDTASKL